MYVRTLVRLHLNSSSYNSMFIDIYAAVAGQKKTLHNVTCGAGIP